MKKQNESVAARGAEETEQVSGKADNTDAVHSKPHAETGLAPCPFCGNNNLIQIHATCYHVVHCRVCAGEISSPHLDNAHAAWNKRAPLTATTSGLLQDALEACNFVCRLWSKKSDPTSSEVNECYEECRKVLQRATKDLEGATRTPQGQPSEATDGVFVLIQHGESGDPNVLTICRTKDERIRVTREAILGDNNEGQGCLELQELEETGIVNFEGDPPLRWFDCVLAKRESLISSHEPKPTVEGENKISASPTLTEGKEEKNL